MSSSNIETVELRIAARAENVALARLTLSGVASAAGVPPDVVADLKLAVSEACTNAVQHAYAGADEGQYTALSRFGEHIGLAFQIVDDILDVEESSEALGKTAGKDAQQGKITFPAVYGLEPSRRMAEQAVHTGKRRL